MHPIAYTYEAAYHCPAHAAARFGHDRDGDITGIDSEGNAVGAVAPWDEWWDPSTVGCQLLVCDDDVDDVLARMHDEATCGARRFEDPCAAVVSVRAFGADAVITWPWEDDRGIPFEPITGVVDTVIADVSGSLMITVTLADPPSTP